MAKYRNNRPRKCGLCGKVAELTKDHLPQKGLYPKSIRHNLKPMNSIDTCKECNSGASEDDEFLKVVVGDIGDVPWQQKAQDGVLATLEGNQQLARLLERQAYWDTEVEPDGTTRKVKCSTLPSADSKRFFKAVSRTVKALYFQTFDEVLVERHEISDFNPAVVHPSLQKNIREQFDLAAEHSVNEDTVRYRFFTPQLSSMVCYISLFKNFELWYVIQEKSPPQNED